MCCIFLFSGKSIYSQSQTPKGPSQAAFSRLTTHKSFTCRPSSGHITSFFYSPLFRLVFVDFPSSCTNDSPTDENVNFGPASLFDSTSGPSRELFLKHEIEQRRKQEANLQWSDNNFRFYFTHNLFHFFFPAPNPQGNTSSTSSSSTIVVVGQTHFPILAQSKSERIFPSLVRIHHTE